MKEKNECLTDEQILQRLLAVDTVPEKTVMLDRFGIPVTMKGLTSKQVFTIQERCTIRNKKNGTSHVDSEDFNAGLIAAATVKPNWGDPQLIAKFKASGPEEVIKRQLLAGEMDALSDVVLDLSGYNTELEDVKN